MCGRNTENKEARKDVKLARYRGKLYTISKVVYEEKHIVFNHIGMNRRKIEIKEGVSVILAIVV